jgi:hypothetical protein
MRDDWRAGRATLRAAWTLAAVLTASASLAQGPAGPEFNVGGPGGTTVGHSIAALADGRFLVTWKDSSMHLSARVFDRAGAPLTELFVVSTSTSRSPSVAAVGDAYVIVWESQAEIRARRFDAGGSQLGDEFRVSSGAPSQDGIPHVAADVNGGFLVAWTNHSGADGSGRGIFARRYGPTTVPLGPPFQVNSYTTGSQGYPAGPAVAVGDDGAFAIAWASGGGGGSPWAVSGQVFDGTGSPRGQEFRVAEGTGLINSDSCPAMAPDGTGGFVVAWSGRLPPQLPHDVVVRRVDANGVPVGSQSHLDDTPFTYASQPRIVPLGSSRFVALWHSWLRFPWDHDSDLRARFFDANLSPQGPEFRVGARVLVGAPSVTPASDGGFVAAWAAPKGPWAELYARRFTLLAPARASLADSGNGVLEPGESAVYAPTWTNHGDLLVMGLTAEARTFTGPGGALYTIADGQAAFGNIAPGATVSCEAAGDCYRLAVASPAVRPVLHWDASLGEELSTGQPQATAVHVGESFSDVPRTSPLYRSVETALHSGLTAGCGGGAFCPDAPITRAQMSLFVLTAREGAGFRPYDCSAPGFEDVPPQHAVCPWIDELGWRGVIGGCGNGNFCPDDPVTRAQAAVFLLRTLDPALSPPPCGTPIFSDVPASSPYCPWIEELVRRGVVTGCGAGRYCPDDPTTRGQAAVMLTETFGLTLYGVARGSGTYGVTLTPDR